jgi:hypothetical protein
MASVSEAGRFLVLLSLEGGMSSQNAYTTEGCKLNLSTVLYLEYYYPKYSHDARSNWDEQILVNQDKALPRDMGRSNGGCEESVQETGKKTNLHCLLRQ